MIAFWDVRIDHSSAMFGALPMFPVLLVSYLFPLSNLLDFCPLFRDTRDPAASERAGVLSLHRGVLPKWFFDIQPIALVR